MKIKFIQPYSGDPKGLLTNYDYIAKMFYPIKRKDIPNRMFCMSLAFPILAAITPPEFEIEILDESTEYIDYDDPVDIVALTGMTYMAPHAYNLAKEFKKRGVYVVMGGVHVSSVPDEALQHLDTVFVGECENIWREFIDDFKQGKPKRKYQETGIVSLDEFILPRWDLVKNKYYAPYFIQASRGCCFKCDFCQLHLTFGNTVRYKKPEQVIAEIKQLYSIYKKEFWGGTPMLFSDDNIIANIPKAKELFKALIPLNIKWFSLASSNVARNEGLLDLMVESGCDHLSVGFESLSQESMDLVNKGSVNQVELYKDDIKMMHSKGLNVSALMMFGLDGDDRSIFQETVDFIDETNLEYPIFHTLLPLPGTVLTESLEKEKRILTYDWTKYTGYYSCIEPKKMTAEELERGNDWTTKEVYTEEAILGRINRLYDEGTAMTGEKNYYFTRIVMSLYCIREMLKKRFIKKDKRVAKFIWKLTKILWTKKKIKIGAVFFFIDYFDYCCTIPDLEPVVTVEEKSA
ncbi:MAG: B12-binding domain-containing radical SAM protein [bacterium]|nr:B12-binding domain-containing radical SAM protein [bacterium]